MNIISSTELKWLFGGKTQQGWALYEPLVRSEIGCDADLDSADFARAVARWQETRGVAGTGIISEETWSKMIGEFQGRRIKVREYPSPQELVTIPTTEAYDPDRPAELRQISGVAYAAYKRMLAAAIANGALGLRVTRAGELEPQERYLKIISAFRSREYQDQLRRQSPNSGRAGLAVNSPHFTGRAIDLYVGGEPVNTNDRNRIIQTQTPVYRWLVKNAARFGFRPYFYEPWHWEYVD